MFLHGTPCSLPMHHKMLIREEGSSKMATPLAWTIGWLHGHLIMTKKKENCFELDWNLVICYCMESSLAAVYTRQFQLFSWISTERRRRSSKSNGTWGYGGNPTMWFGIELRYQESEEAKTWRSTTQMTKLFPMAPQLPNQSFIHFPVPMRGWLLGSVTSGQCEKLQYFVGYTCYKWG